MSGPSWASSDLPLERPSVARMYDYLLGGYHMLLSIAPPPMPPS